MHQKRTSDKAAILLATITVVGIAALGIFFYERSHTVLDSMLKDKLRGFAALGALQFSAEEIDAVQGVDDFDTHTHAEIVSKLAAIKNSIPEARYVYIMRRTDTPMELEFVADAESALTIDELDENQDGLVDETEAPSLPGDPYNIAEAPVMQEEAFDHPATDDELTVDQWGTFLSGYAPIRDANGNTVAIIGIDMLADEYIRQIQSIFTVFGAELLITVCTTIVLSMVYVLGRKKIHEVEDSDRVEA
jgi:hypothetical protein